MGGLQQITTHMSSHDIVLYTMLSIDKKRTVTRFNDAILMKLMLSHEGYVQCVASAFTIITD